MEFGVFTVSDITRDPITGYTPSEAERIDATVQIAKKAEEVSLDVFAVGEHHNPPFFSSSPTTLLAYIAAQTNTLKVSTSTTLITTNDPVRIAEEYAMLQHLAKGRMDLMLGRGNTAPVGLCGVLTMMALVRGEKDARSEPTSNRNRPSDKTNRAELRTAPAIAMFAA